MPTATTVTGVVDVGDLGVCLSHEHLINDVTSWWSPPQDDRHAFLIDSPVSIDILWELRQDPFSCRANCQLDDEEVAIAEVQRFADLGGQTILEATSASIGRDPLALRRISEQTGVQIIMGAGLYLDSSMPAEADEWSEEHICERILEDIEIGIGGVRAGFIGEIGVSSEFTPRERKSLRAAAQAQAISGVPLQVHLPGWFRLGDEVLDVVEQAGGNLNATVLCHMNPTGQDSAYQDRLARRGAWLQFDMIGMEVFYADQGVQCPSDEDNARAIIGLLERGWGDQILVSSDIFLKSLLRKFGGPGYGHILEYFLPRLRRHGVSEHQVMALVTKNPRRLFEASSIQQKVG
jgi:phosphotriesterase-related protein